MIVLLFVSEEPKPKRKFSCKSLEDSDSKFLPIIQKKPTDLREKAAPTKTKTKQQNKKKLTNLREKAAPTQQNNNKAKKADKPEREGSEQTSLTIKKPVILV